VDEVKRAVDLAGELGTKLVNTTVPAPTGSRPSQIVKRSSNLPVDYSWSDDWARYTCSMAECVAYAETAGCSVMLEAFAGSICSTPDAYFRLGEIVGFGSFGWNLDTCHLDMQRQDVALAVYKLGSSVYHTHIKDSDGLPAGMGRVDFEEVLRALDAVGYDGVLSIEAELFDKTSRYSRAAKAHIEAILRGEW
jgi:sugar phosphate isomerase/epimerase